MWANMMTNTNNADSLFLIIEFMSGFLELNIDAVIFVHYFIDYEIKINLLRVES